jgi:hypothetical protein
LLNDTGRSGDDALLGGIVDFMVISLYMPIFTVFDLIRWGRPAKHAPHQARRGAYARSVGPTRYRWDALVGRTDRYDGATSSLDPDVPPLVTRPGRRPYPLALLTVWSLPAPFRIPWPVSVGPAPASRAARASGAGQRPIAPRHWRWRTGGLVSLARASFCRWSASKSALLAAYSAECPAATTHLGSSLTMAQPGSH